MSSSPEKRPLILGLTGSIAMGKSTVADMLEGLGVPVFDADHEVRMMQGPGGALLPQIEAAFPGSTGPEGVNRKKLGDLVFGDRDELAKLEVLIHPAVAQARETFLYRHANAPLVVFDIPLLFEKGSDKEVDKVAVVSAPPEVQRARVLERDGMTAAKFEQILELQLPDAAKRARADFVIDTGTSLEETQEAVQELVENLSSGLPD